MSQITKITARQIIDSRATPTVEVDIYLNDGAMGRAAVPSGASTGIHEALELRDGDSTKFLGKGVLKAIENINSKISPALLNQEIIDQRNLDQLLKELDGTQNKSSLGANAILAVSLAFAHATAASQKLPLFKLIQNIYLTPQLSGQPASGLKLPRPMFNIINGGRHANWATDIQEFMVLPNETKFQYADQLRVACEVFLTLGKILEENGLDTDVGNEGGYAPGFKSNSEALEYIAKAVERAGYKLGDDIHFGLDVASSEFYSPETQTYTLKTENRTLTPDQWLSEQESWMAKYPLISIEDPFGQDDWTNWQNFTAKHGDKIQVVGDDLLVTNVERVKQAIESKACNALLVKVNQIGTLTEALDAMKMAEGAGWKNVVSHRSGETEDITISHIAVGTGCGQIKIGAPSRGERTAKYNELLRIAEQI